ncbi:MAG: acyl--CoA ligase [Verrucomicrobia bacterium]|nr:acyl--CoA ligase [Verrucomicrobiota bacterium]
MLDQLLNDACARTPEKTALIFGDQGYTFSELDEITSRLATSLSERGIKAGDRVAFLLPNCPEIVWCYFACFRIGAIAVPLNIRFGSELLRYVVGHCEAKALISEPELFVRLGRDSLGTVEQYYLLSGHSDFAGVQSFAELLTEEGRSPESLKLDETIPATIYYTSGTTGLPKAVIHTHGSLRQATDNQIAEIGISAADKTLIMFPVCYLIGFGSQILPFLACGATCVLLSHFETGLALRAIEEHRPTKTYGFPKLYQELINHPESDRFNLRSLNFCFSGGEAIAVAIQERFEQLFGVAITEGCGMTELQIYSLNPPYGKKKVGSIGRPICGMEVRLIDESGQSLINSGAIGEIVVRGGSMTAGYWHDPERTARTICDGWLHTGDLAYQDADGFYWFFSRQSEVIRGRAGLVSPIEVEGALYQHPAVKEVGVTGFSDAGDEAVQAHVVLKENAASVTSTQLLNFARQHLPAQKVPARIIIVSELPYGPTGKIDRLTLRAQNAT